MAAIPYGLVDLISYNACNNVTVVYVCSCKGS